MQFRPVRTARLLGIIRGLDGGMLSRGHNMSHPDNDLSRMHIMSVQAVNPVGHNGSSEPRHDTTVDLVTTAAAPKCPAHGG